MASEEYSWKMPNDGPGGWAIRVAMAATNLAREIMEHAYPEYLKLCPFDYNVHAQAEIGADWYAVRTKWTPKVGTHMAGRFDEENERQQAITHLGDGLAGFWSERVDALGSAWCSPDTFTCFGKVQDGHISWQAIRLQMILWLSKALVPRVEDINRRSVERAIPRPPSFQIANILPALWVLESEKEMKQGTAFELEGVGLVTCDHVIAPDTVAFRYGDVSRRWPIAVLKRSTRLDLAVLNFPEQSGAKMARGSADSLQQMDHMLVVGHPNYRHGDTPVTTPGIMVGFRQKSGIRHLLTNAPIVAGMSGGPAIGGSGAVVGVCVTGADSFAAAPATEDHGIIPIEALDLI